MTTDANKIFSSMFFKTIFIILGGLAIVFIIFKIGMITGYKKADFSRSWTENYHHNFGGPRGGFMREFDDSDFIAPHGVAGQVIKIENSSLIIKGRDNIEKIVLVSDSAFIHRFRESIKITDIKIDEYIVVIGEPNSNGQIEAKFIRVMPKSPMGLMFNGKIPPMRHFVF